jgi:hypothetical protein
MIELSSIRDIVTIFGVIAGFTYYVMTVRHQNSSRKAQLFIEMYRDFKNPDVQRALNDIVFVWEWDNFQDYQEKYGRHSNYDEHEKYQRVYSVYEGLGVLIHRNLIDVKMIDEIMRSHVLMFWEKIGPIMRELRIHADNPWIAEWTEHLYHEVKKIESTPMHVQKNY